MPDYPKNLDETIDRVDERIARLGAYVRPEPTAPAPPKALLVNCPVCGETITHAYPVAVQRGTTAEIDVAGQMNFAGAYKALVEGTGVTAEVSSPPPVPGTLIKNVKMKVTVVKDAPLGVREFRIATMLGVS